MAAAGTILGGMSLLIQVLNGCKKGYATIASALQMPDEFRYLSVQFEMEHSRLQDFSQAAGLAEETTEDNRFGRGGSQLQAKEQVLLSVLTEIISVLDTFAKSHAGNETPQTHNDASLPFPRDEQRSLGEAYSSIASNTVAPQKPSPGIYRSIRWSVFDKEEFVRLLQRLRRSNGFLHELLDDNQTRILQDVHQETNMELVQVRNLVSDLRTLVEASQCSRKFLDQSTEWQQKAGLELENLATFKALYASLLARTRSHYKNLSIAPSHVQFQDVANMNENHPRALFGSDKVAPRTVWINWQNHETPDHDFDEPSLASIEELTILLMAPKPAEFCVPPCLGYCNLALHEEQRLGLIFENPSHINDHIAPQSLLHIIKETPKPSLTRRIALAYKLAQCLLYFHSVNWLHKAFRSENILLFPSADSIEYDVTSPYLTGFDYSRRARFNEATADVPRVGSMEAYRHPDIQMNGPRLYYRKTFDIYSLGVILIEIAHWRPIASIMDIEDTIDRYPKATSDIRSRWLHAEPALLDRLQAEVGNKYASAVRICIAGRDSFGVTKLDLETSADTSLVIQHGFNGLVVKKLHEVIT